MSEFRSIQSTGHKQLLSILKEKLSFKSKQIALGIGDDAAVINFEPSHRALFTSETFIEGVDFDLTYSPLHHLAYKLFNRGVNDIYAMNGTPVAATINLALPNKVSVQMCEQLYDGFNAASTEHNCEIAGGDLNASTSGMVVSISVAGSVAPEEIVTRGGAQDKDAICITGDIGSALAGLRVLMREKKYWQEQQSEEMQPDLTEYEYVVRRQLLGLHRKDLISKFKEMKILPSSMIDISKGLAHELQAICEASDCGASIFEAALPIDLATRKVADEMQEDVDKYALFGGEDMEMLFTVSKDKIKKITKHFSDFTVIGEISCDKKEVSLQTVEGDTITLT